jgi:hypothetical protein
LYLMELGDERVIPFTPAQLDDIAGRCLTVTKKIKTVQYRDVKFRLIQTMRGMLRSRIAGATLRITFFIASYIGGFLNVIICNIEDHKVHMAYSILVNGIDPEALKIKIKHNIEVSRVKCLGKYDGGSIPELDAFLQEGMDAS